VTAGNGIIAILRLQGRKKPAALAVYYFEKEIKQ